MLALAVGLGAVIGLERDLRRRPAGMRTSAFIALGAALATLISEVLARQHGGDPQRIASYILVGVGFVGAGAVIRERGAVTGLTSAATVFVSAAIGMACGGGLVWYALIATGIVAAVLRGFTRLERGLGIKSTTVEYIAFGGDAAALVSAVGELTRRRRHALAFLRVQPLGERVIAEFGVGLMIGEEDAFLSDLRRLPELTAVAEAHSPGHA